MRVSVDSYKSQTSLRREIGESYLLVYFVLFSSDGGAVLCFSKTVQPQCPHTRFDDSTTSPTCFFCCWDVFFTRQMSQQSEQNLRHKNK